MKKSNVEERRQRREMWIDASNSTTEGEYQTDFKKKALRDNNLTTRHQTQTPGVTGTHSSLRRPQRVATQASITHKTRVLSHSWESPKETWQRQRGGRVFWKSGRYQNTFPSLVDQTWSGVWPRAVRDSESEVGRKVWKTAVFKNWQFLHA